MVSGSYGWSVWGPSVIRYLFCMPRVAAHQAPVSLPLSSERVDAPSDWDEVVAILLEGYVAADAAEVPDPPALSRGRRRGPNS